METGLSQFIMVNCHANQIPQETMSKYIYGSLNCHHTFVVSNECQRGGQVRSYSYSPILLTGVLCSDTQQSQVVKLRLIRTLFDDLPINKNSHHVCLVHRASDLPDSRLGLSKYFATLKTSAGWSGQTDQKSGKVQWEKEFIW